MQDYNSPTKWLKRLWQDTSHYHIVNATVYDFCTEYDCSGHKILHFILLWFNPTEYFITNNKRASLYFWGNYSYSLFVFIHQSKHTLKNCICITSYALHLEIDFYQSVLWDGWPWNEEIIETISHLLSWYLRTCSSGSSCHQPSLIKILNVADTTNPANVLRQSTIPDNCEEVMTAPVDTD